MSWINKVAKHHKEYVNTIKGFGEDFYAEDLVQEMYVRFITKNKEQQVMNKGEVNRYYVYLTLRSLFVDFYRQKSKIIKINVNEILNLEQIDEIEQHEAFGSLINKVSEEMNNWHHYDRLLFQLYKDSNMSMREIVLELEAKTQASGVILVRETRQPRINTILILHEDVNKLKIIKNDVNFDILPLKRIII